jgi:hypothetical protein
VKSGSDVWGVTAGVTKDVQEQLDSKYLCVEAMIKPLKKIPKRTGRIAGQSFNMAKITFSS